MYLSCTGPRSRHFGLTMVCKHVYYIFNNETWEAVVCARCYTILQNVWCHCYKIFFFQCFLNEMPVTYIKVVNRCMDALSWWSPGRLVTVCVQEVRVDTGNSRMWLVSFTVSYFLFLIVAVVKALWTGSSHPSAPACRHGNEPPASANQSLRCCGPVRGPSTPPDAHRGTMNTGPSPKKLLLSVRI